MAKVALHQSQPFREAPRPTLSKCAALVYLRTYAVAGLCAKPRKIGLGSDK
ncbi:MAG: hypothetical protein NVS2B7_34190 [Herpetosiphon sp.]